MGITAPESGAVVSGASCIGEPEDCHGQISIKGKVSLTLKNTQSPLVLGSFNIGDQILGWKEDTVLTEELDKCFDVYC